MWGKKIVKTYLTQIIPLIKSKIINNSQFLTLFELSSFIKKNSFDLFDGKLSFCYPFNNGDDSLNSQIYNLSSLLKNLTVRNETRVKQQIKQSNDTSLVNNLEKLKLLKRQLSIYEQLSKADQPTFINELNSM